MVLKNWLKELTSLYSESEIRRLYQWSVEEIFSQHYSLVSKEELASSEVLNEILVRLKEGEPFQYVIGNAEFCGLKITVDKNVLIPRSETEELVLWIQEGQANNGKGSFIDLCTGSGCIALAIKKYFPAAHVCGVDVSMLALKVAEQNSNDLELKVGWYQMDVLKQDGWPLKNKVDIIVSNPPYIPINESSMMDKSVLTHEPHLALFVEDDDPLLFYKQIKNHAEKNLHQGGWLYFEMNEFNSADLFQLFNSDGSWSMTEIKKDMQGKPRMFRSCLSASNG